MCQIIILSSIHRKKRCVWLFFVKLMPRWKHFRDQATFSFELIKNSSWTLVYSSSIAPTLPHSANAVIKLSAARETHKNDHHHNARPRTFFFGKTTRRKDVRFSTKETFINDIETSSFLWPRRGHICEEWIIALKT